MTDDAEISDFAPSVACWDCSGTSGAAPALRACRENLGWNNNIERWAERRGDDSQHPTPHVLHLGFCQFLLTKYNNVWCWCEVSGVRASFLEYKVWLTWFCGGESRAPARPLTPEDNQSCWGDGSGPAWLGPSPAGFSPSRTSSLFLAWAARPAAACCPRPPPPLDWRHRTFPTKVQPHSHPVCPSPSLSHLVELQVSGLVGVRAGPTVVLQCPGAVRPQTAGLTRRILSVQTLTLPHICQVSKINNNNCHRRRRRMGRRRPVKTCY